MKKLYKENDPLVLICFYYLGRVCEHFGDFKQAFVYYGAFLKISQNIL